MDADAEEKISESRQSSKDESEKRKMDNKTKGWGFKGRGCGGHRGRGTMRGGWGLMKGYGPCGHVRGRPKGAPMNGFAPIRGMMRMRPYPGLRSQRGRNGPVGIGPPHPPPPMHLRGSFPPRHRAPPPGYPGFRGRGALPPGPPRHFHYRGPRGYHNGPLSLPPQPQPGRGQRWPGPPEGRRF